MTDGEIVDHLVDEPARHRDVVSQKNDDRERAGFILFAVLAIAFPVLVTLGFIWSANPVIDENAEQRSSGLESVELTEFPESSVPEASDDETSNPPDQLDGETAVAGSAEAQATQTTESGVAAQDTASPAPSSDRSPAGATPATSGPSVTPADDGVDGSVTEPAPTGSDGGGTFPINVGRRVSDASPTTTESRSPSPTTTEDQVGVGGVRETAPTTTGSPAIAAPTTTSRPATTTTTAAPVVEPPEFSQRIDVGRISDTSLAMRFQTTADANYTLIVRSGGAVARTVQGFSEGGRLENVTIDALTHGTDYTVEAVLDTSPSVTSPAVAFRTSGGAPEPAEQSVTLINPRVVDLQSTRFEVNYESNICANGSFVIRDSAGTIVGSNSGQAAGCTTRHLAIPGFWTSALRPNTTYVITITVEANGAGQGGSNTAATSLAVTTSG